MFFRYYELSQTHITPFVVINWAACMFCFLWFIYIYICRRYLFVKPSIMVLFFTHVLLQWPATVYAGFYEQYLPQPYDMLALTAGFVLVGLAVSTRTQVALSKNIWWRIVHGAADVPDTTLDHAIVCLFVIMLACLTIYISAVPFSETGLYAILYDPVSAAFAREESLKLLESPLVRYSYSIMKSAVASLFAGLLIIKLMQAWTLRQILMVLACMAGIVFVMVAVTFSGSRIAMVNILLVLMLVPMFRNGLPFKPLHALIALFIILMPAVVISMMRESQVPSIDLLGEYFGYIFYRIIETLEVDGWYVHSAQTWGHFGIVGIPKLADLFGETALNVPNLIGLKYAEYASETTSATAGYVFYYYGLIGLPSLIVSFPLLLVLDAALYVFVKFKPAILLASMAAIAKVSLSFVQSDYTTTLVTHGFLGTLFFSYILGKKITFGNGAKLTILESGNNTGVL